MSTSIRLEPQLVERLERLSAITGRSKSFYVREAIETHLDDLEDIYLSEREYEAIKAGRSVTTPLDDVIAEIAQNP